MRYKVSYFHSCTTLTKFALVPGARLLVWLRRLATTSVVTRIDGQDGHSVLKIIGEIGTDMAR